ncbi:MAG: polysaccharide deacetylase family protein [Krumholzibacteria bacterium]|nr:polysaccharide deacetylase family protein [Candidatus Krumholzibacteria bacterium]
MGGRRHGAGSALLVLLGCLLGCLAAGCGDEGGSDAPAAAYHHLDPPDLANELIRRGEPGVPVLCYHYFRRDFAPGYLAKVLGSVLFGMPALGDREFWTTPRAEFARHLAWFRDTGTQVMTLDEVADLVAAGRPLPARAVVLTIDDADRSVYEIAWPLLQEYGVRAHLFVPTAKVGGPWSSLELCRWEELREMAASGAVLVESHAHDLHHKIKTRGGYEPVFWHPYAVPPPASREARAELAQRWAAAEPQLAGDRPGLLLGGALGPIAVDLVTSRLELLAGAGRAPRWLAWPYGFAGADLDSLARTVGFRGTVSLRPLAFSAADSTFASGRVALTAKSTMDQIVAIWAPDTP